MTHTAHSQNGGDSVAVTLLKRHVVEGELRAGADIALRIDQTLTQDATGTLVMLELEAMGLDRVRTEVSAQYVDHNLIQEDHRNADDHRFLLSACQRFGVWYSRPGNGVSHPLHMQHFGRPGASLLGSDSHTCAAGAIGMLALGAGGLDVALAMAGEPYWLKMPRILGVELVGSLPPWVSAKDVILEMLRRFGVRGGVGFIFEYFGPGLEALSAWDRHVIANMGVELGATATVFPADAETERFLAANGRAGDYTRLTAGRDAPYDEVVRVDLSGLEPLIAKPSSPGNVVPVREVAGEPIGQAYLGSSANPGYRDFAVPAVMVEGRRVPDHVSFDVNPASRSVLADLMRSGLLASLVRSGARLHQAGCNGCIGMGQAPATDYNSLRTVPRNFPGRSGTREDRVWLCSPETATASALTGVITDPRELGLDYPRIAPLAAPLVDREMFLAPASAEREVALVKGPNIASLPELEPLGDVLDVPVALVVGDDLSTDEIMPAGARVLPFRSNIPRIAEYCFEGVDPGYVARARQSEGHALVAGENYGQGSSREHAALAPRYLGLRVVLAGSFARIHRRNLVNFGILPLLVAGEVRERLGRASRVVLRGLREGLREGRPLWVEVDGEESVEVAHDLTAGELETLWAGGRIRQVRERLARR
jgi:aconitate hydratase